ncbi:hypothetical protein [Lederbergia lenta]|uniref:hypothetical protein n=1 Tax=Lederbergia lenta TaxID=1467 RepID=UPI00203CB9D2|nr:hypothetical protein [Lederbergia lenta]MCM3112825.1 hypothetical protein [Lederbergia lenta]
MKEKDDVKPIKTNGGDGIYLFWEAKMVLDTELTICMNSMDRYYYENVGAKQKQTVGERLSNFIIEPLFVTEDSDKKIRYISKFVSKGYSKVIEIDGETLALNNSFKKFCMSYGMFNWRGKQYHLDDLAEFIMANTTKKLTTIKFSGYNSHEKTWFFPTHAYFKANVYYPDKDGIFEINHNHYKLELEKDDDYVIYQPIVASPTKPYITKFFSDLKVLYGKYFYLTFGYIASSFNADVISAKTDFFPFMYIYGKQSSGKSTIMNIFSKFSGMKVSLTSPPTLDGLRKAISKRANVPFVIDEADKDDRSRGRDFFKFNSDVLKVIYMRQALVRGHKDENAVIRYPIRGTLFLGGEVLTSVASIIQRSILMDSSKIVKNEQVFNNVRESEIPIWVGQYLMQSSHEWQSNVLELYNEITNYFIKQGWVNIDVRVRSNYAIFLAGAFAALKQLNAYFNEELFLNDKEELKNIYLFVYGEMKETQRMTESDHPSDKFLTKIGLLANNQVLLPNVDYKYEKQKDGNILLYLAPTNVADAYKNHEKNPFYSTSNKALKDIQNQSFFKGTKKTRIGKSQPSAWIIQLTNPEKPESIQEGIVHPDLPDTMIYFYHG